MGIVEIEFVQQHQVRAHLLQHGGDLACVLAVALQFLIRPPASSEYSDVL